MLTDLQANGAWSTFGDVTTITTKDTDARTGIGMRLSERGHVVGIPTAPPFFLQLLCHFMICSIFDLTLLIVYSHIITYFNIS